MSKAGKRILEGMAEMKAIVTGAQPAARVHMNGFTYVPEDQWQSIDAAPKDGSQILAAWKRPDGGTDYGVIWWARNSWFEHDLDNPVGDPDAWQPLPAFPPPPHNEKG